jgi:hypothetical protein
MRLGLWRWAAVGAVLYAGAAVVLTWPLFRHPGTTVLDTVSLYGPAAILIQRDINLTMWKLAWDSHALLTDPLRLFHANAFYPAPYTLALSEHALGNAIFFLPVYVVSGNPVLAHQATLLATFALAGFTMAAYVLYWTRDRAAALAAGALYAFAPFRLWQLGSLDYISIHWLPLVLLGIDLVLDRRGGAGASLMLGGALVLSSLCSYYVGYTAFLLAAAYLGAALWVRGRTALPRLLPLGGAIAGAAAVVAILTLPYVLLQRSGALPDYGEKEFTSLAFLSMLRFGLSGVLGYYVFPRRDGIPTFLTYTVLALAAMALVTVRSRAVRTALLVAGVSGLVVALGPFLYLPYGIPELPLPYYWLAKIVPGFSAMRAPQRFGALPVLAATALAGLALASVRERLRTRFWPATVLPWLAVAAMFYEATPRGLRPMGMAVGETIPPAYRWLAAHGEGGPLLELPPNPLDHHRESVFLYYSTFHWLPLANGYVGYPPQSYREIMDIAGRLHEPGALEALRQRVALRWILLHRRDNPYLPPEYESTLRARLRIVADFGDDVIFEVGG